MEYDGIILYGPPASGKDTVTVALTELNSQYAQFKRIKVGEGRRSSYRWASESQIIALRKHNQILYQSTRYEALYLVDTPHLDELFNQDLIPIVHVGQIAGVDAVKKYPRRWLDVLLWCPRHVTEQRLRERGSTDVRRRLAAWDETLDD